MITTRVEIEGQRPLNLGWEDADGLEALCRLGKVTVTPDLVALLRTGEKRVAELQAEVDRLRPSTP